jgi:casein kinase 1
MAGHHRQTRTNSSTSVSSSNVVGVHYKVGRKIGEGSFGIIHEGIVSRTYFAIVCVYTEAF